MLGVGYDAGGARERLIVCAGLCVEAGVCWEAAAFVGAVCSRLSVKEAEGCGLRVVAIRKDMEQGASVV